MPPTPRPLRRPGLPAPCRADEPLSPGSGRRVDAAGRERMAAAQTPRGKAQPPAQTVPLQARDGVLAARGIKLAVPDEQGADSGLVAADQGHEGGDAQACPSRNNRWGLIAATSPAHLPVRGFRHRTWCTAIVRHEGRPLQIGPSAAAPGGQRRAESCIGRRSSTVTDFSARYSRLSRVTTSTSMVCRPGSSNDRWPEMPCEIG